MFTLIVIGIFVLIIAIIIYFEYKNEKEYQENRHKRTEERKKTKPPYDSKEKVKKPLIEKNEKISVVEPRKVASAKELKEVEEKKKLEEKKLEERRLEEEHLKQQKLERQRVEKQHLEEIKIEEQKRLEEEKTEPELIPEPEVTEKIDLPECNYPIFDHSRLIEMGLSDDEAKEFVAELIPQLEIQIPLIKEAMEIPDLQNIERLTHSIKGSSTTVGTGGISDLLVEFNTYIKTGTEPAIIEAYFEHLKHYSKELKEQYS